jgi:hypothetical protein
VKERGGKTSEHMAGEVVHELLMVWDWWKVVLDDDARRRPLAVAVLVARGQRRPQLGREWAEIGERDMKFGCIISFLKEEI